MKIFFCKNCNSRMFLTGSTGVLKCPKCSFKHLLPHLREMTISEPEKPKRKKKFRFLYRCRLCGERFVNEAEFFDAEKALERLVMLPYEKGIGRTGVPMAIWLHYDCPKGIGMADLQGWWNGE